MIPVAYRSSTNSRNAEEWKEKQRQALKNRSQEIDLYTIHEDTATVYLEEPDAFPATMSYLLDLVEGM